MAKKVDNPQGRQKRLSLWPLKPEEADRVRAAARAAIREIREQAAKEKAEEEGE